MSRGFRASRLSAIGRLALWRLALWRLAVGRLAGGRGRQAVVRGIRREFLRTRNLCGNAATGGFLIRLGPWRSLRFLLQPLHRFLGEGDDVRRQILVNAAQLRHFGWLEER